MGRQILSMLVFAAALSAAGGAMGDETEVPGHWNTVKVRGFDTAQLAPEASFGGYDSLYVAAVALEFDERWQQDLRSRLSPRDAERLRADYGDLVRQALASGLSKATGLPLTDTPTAESLVARPALTRFRLTAPDLPSDPIKVSYVDYVGAARLTVDVFAGDEGEHLGRFSDYSQTRSFGGMDDLKRTNRVVNRRDVRFLAERWGDRLGRFLAGATP